MGIPSQAAILRTHSGAKAVSPHAGFGRDYERFQPFSASLDILLPMSGFSLPDIPSVTLGAVVAEAA
jgi:hypothetical protein